MRRTGIVSGAVCEQISRRCLQRASVHARLRRRCTYVVVVIVVGFFIVLLLSTCTVFIQVFQSYLAFCGIGIHNAQMYERLQLENRRNQVLVSLRASRI